MFINVLDGDGSVRRTIDLDSFTGERLHVALLECHKDRIERAGDPIYPERLRQDFACQALALSNLLKDLFPHTEV